MDRAYHELLGKCLELKDIVYQHGPYIRNWLKTARYKRDQKAAVRMKESCHLFDETLKIIDRMVEKACKAEKKYPLVNIISRFNLDQVERVLLYYCLAERLEDEKIGNSTGLLLLLSKGEYSKLVELWMKYLQLDSKLNKERIIFPLTKNRCVISGKIYDEITGATTLPENKEKVSEIGNISSPEEIYSVLSRKVIGQEEAKRALSISVFQHYQRITGKTKIKNSNVILIGPTGIGKTYLARTLADYLKVPMVFCSANEFSETGYVGKSVSDIIGELWGKADSDSEKAGKGIIFIDEIDKIATCSSVLPHHSNRDVSGRSVQEELLDLLESSGKRTFRYGYFLHDSVSLDVSKILFIAAGAFDGIEEIREKRRKKQLIGFHAGLRVGNGKNAGQVETEDLIDYGLIPELVGRFSTIVTLDSLNTEDLIEVMVAPEDALLNQYKDYFKQYGIELEVEQSALGRIAAIAYERGTGARGLRSIFESILRPYLFNIARKDNKISRIVIDEKHSYFQNNSNGKCS